MQTRFYEQSGQTPPSENDNTSKNKSKVTINYPSRKKHFDVDDIDYVDFEEVKEKEPSIKQ